MKKKILSVFLTICIMVSCLFCLTACGDDKPNSGNNGAARTTLPNIAELAYGGFTESDWHQLTNNELNNLTVKDVDVTATASGEDAKGFLVYYSGFSLTKFNSLSERLYNSLNANKNDQGQAVTLSDLTSDTNGVYYFLPLRTINAGTSNEADYEISLIYYSVDKTVGGITFSAGDVLISSYAVSASNPGDEPLEPSSWFSASQLESLKLTGLTMPTGTVVSKSYDTDLTQGIDIEAMASYTVADATVFTTYTQYLFNNFGANKTNGNQVIATYAEAINTNPTVIEFTGYIFGTNYKVQVSVAFVTSLSNLTLTVYYYDTTPTA